MAAVEKTHLVGILGVLAILDLVVLALGGYIMDDLINGYQYGANGATFWFVLISLIAGMLLVAAIISGLIHFRHYSSGSVGSASSLALVAWVVMLLAFGFACKEIDLGHTGSHTRAMEAFVFILTFFESLYVLVLHAGLFNSNYGVGY